MGKKRLADGLIHNEEVTEQVATASLLVRALKKVSKLIFDVLGSGEDDGGAAGTGGNNNPLHLPDFANRVVDHGGEATEKASATQQSTGLEQTTATAVSQQVLSLQHQ